MSVPQLFISTFLLLILPSIGNASITKADIHFADSLHVTLDENGFKTNGVKIFGSFSLQNEESRIIYRYKEIKFPQHEIVLAQKDYTIYILDLQKEKMIGKFKIPSRGSPKYVKVFTDENGFTSLQVQFRILPVPKYKLVKEVVGYNEDGSKIIKTVKRQVNTGSFRPGPLNTLKYVYLNGKYVYKRK